VDDGGKKVGFVAVPMILVAGILAALTGAEGRKLTPYQDIAGVWTVCDGITGKAVVIGKKYTNAECDKLGNEYVQKMLADMGKCVRGNFDFNVIKAAGHFSYNVGTPAFCRSTMARKLNSGDVKGACAEITKWVYVAGKDCRDPKSRCAGIVKRREWERATCEGRNQ
jgi:GH24 family phage-related lysozyme (muramidase)